HALQDRGAPHLHGHDPALGPGLQAQYLPARFLDVRGHRHRDLRQAAQGPLIMKKLFAALALGLCAFATQAVAEEPKVLRYAFRIAETGFDPVKLSDIYSRTVTGHIFEGLYTYDYLARPARIVPLIADGEPEI